jgi:hypothetical protein
MAARPFSGLPHIKPFREQRAQKYGLRSHEARLLLCSQNGVCLCCKRVPKPSDVVIDHDHSTGDVRGIICRRCNLLLGHMGDSKESIERRSRMLLKYITAGANSTQAVIRKMQHRAKRPRNWRSRLARLLFVDLWLIPEIGSRLDQHTGLVMDRQ